MPGATHSAALTGYGPDCFSGITCPAASTQPWSKHQQFLEDQACAERSTALPSI